MELTFSPPVLNVWVYNTPSRNTSTSNQSDKAFTTLAPTPWSPPEVLYPPCPNLPPACKTVKITWMVGIPEACFPVGIPRPLSLTDSDPSLWIVTSILLAYPDKASSTALSTIS